MDRRGFVSAVTAVTAWSIAQPTSASALVKPISPSDFFETPTSYVGSRFRLDDGSFLMLTNVNQLSMRSGFVQMEAVFQCSQQLREGLYTLQAPGDAPLVLFLQSRGTEEHNARAIITQRVTGVRT